MIGELTHAQIGHVLRSELIGRIGYSDGKSIYVLPITFVFDGNHIYAHSREGQKIEIMRKHPQVCFEVDRVETMTTWRCVLVHGKFEELSRQDEKNALQILKERLAPYLLGETMKPKGLDEERKSIQKERRPVVFRIQITSMTGRYEKM